ncbi:hypothetical protein B5M44_04340 [Shinella sumterensis]|uniref:hypothetical protein n=1 Tax=Shinella sumterensis TaxID=1967501 RepID=UPI00106E9D3D|nr:hypothetical protein [Shinella sumterensis]MCD1264026.1 hypothetical protein [Shinella sumterensis]TFE99435.1 hypothetical protein B5M44_04340 [Shinella sumterensis]
MAKHHRDPQPTETPKDFDVYGLVPPQDQPTGRTWKRAMTAAACAAVFGLTYALIPIAFAVGGAAIGVWFVGAEFYDWLDRHTNQDRQ